MEYTITAVKFFSDEVYGRDKNHRVVVNLEGEGAQSDKDYSAFVQEKPSVGDKWNGGIKKTEKNDKIYWNFEFDKSTHKTVSQGYQPAGDTNRVEAKVDALRAEIATLGGILRHIESVVAKDEEPQF